MTKKISLYLGYALAFFLGGVGAHLFYYRKYIRAVLYLVFFWTFIPIFLGWIDMFFVKKWNHQLYERKDRKQRQRVESISSDGGAKTSAKIPPTTKASKSEGKQESKNTSAVTVDTVKGKNHTEEPVMAKVEKSFPQSSRSKPVDRLLQSEPDKKKVRFKKSTPPKVKSEKKRKEKNILTGKIFYKFYPEEEIIISKYEHLKTLNSIIVNLKEITNPRSKNLYGDEKFDMRIEFSTSRDDFARHSIKYADEKGNPSKEIPFQQYWPSFSDLDKKQLQWYLYWRGQTLQSNYMEVDLSYIFIFVYELLHYTFNQKAAFNVSMLVRLRENYLNDHPKLDNYLPRWIADMLFELGEEELAQEWSSPPTDVPRLYNIMDQKRLGKISITDWKPYITGYTETKFFDAHRSHIYKVFKESVEILDEQLQQEGTTLREKGFKDKQRRRVRHLYTGLHLSRYTVDVHEHYRSIMPTPYLENAITQLFRLSENVARKEKGENRQIKVEESILPEGIKELMVNRKERFKQVQKRSGEGKGSDIPAPPKDYGKEEEEREPEVVIPQIDRSITDRKKEELNEIQSLIEDEMNKEEDEREQTHPTFENIPEKPEPEEIGEQGATQTMGTDTKVEEVDVFEAFEDDVDVDEFWEELETDEAAFLKLFDDGELLKEKAKDYVKQQGKMLGLFINEINEKAIEHLGENVLEETENAIEIDEEFVGVLTPAKEA